MSTCAFYKWIKSRDSADINELSSKIDESQCRSPPSTFQLNKRKSSFRRILKNPVRRLSLKDNSIIKDAKITSPTDLIASANTISPEDNHHTDPVHKRPPLAFNSANSRKLKAFTFADTADLTSYPDGTNPLSKSIDNDGLTGFYKMTDSSSSSSSKAVPIISPVDNVETACIEIPLSLDIQSQLKLTNGGDSLSPPAAPINVVSALSASDFHIPAALSIETPPTEEISSMKMPSTSTITVTSNDSQSEPTDEISYNDADQTTLSSFATIDEPIDDRTKYGEKRRHNIVELIETEKEYVKDLALIVEGYMNILENDKEIKKPTGLCGRERVVFGNVQKIYEFHRDTFLPQLEQCIETPNILGRLFTTNRFSPYVRYCENKPRSEYIVSEYHDYFEEIRKKLGQKLLVSDLLIKPVQRIMRYQLLLKEILKSTERMGDEPRAIRSALQVMIEVPQQANDMMNVGRIKDLSTNVHQLGELKLQDMLLVSEPITSKDTKDAEKKLKERRVFLFQQSMIFCDEIPAKDKYSSPNYIYKYELKINKLQHKEFKRNKELCQFTLVEVDAGNIRRVICQCKDDEQYELWVTNVNKVLQRQMDLIIALTNPTAALQKDPRSK
ncbi:unnamed protein product [Adineta ricciae]|uniref:DH domain-containing protein n=1 Tax=Adineta ricciae TaxID=249248 RepID=A0A814DXS4_ADIRI|nr:unnamed protein product [Adineta ricciae]